MILQKIRRRFFPKPPISERIPFGKETTSLRELSCGSTFVLGGPGSGKTVALFAPIIYLSVQDPETTGVVVGEDYFDCAIGGIVASKRKVEVLYKPNEIQTGAINLCSKVDDICGLWDALKTDPEEKGPKPFRFLVIPEAQEYLKDEEFLKRLRTSTRDRIAPILGIETLPTSETFFGNTGNWVIFRSIDPKVEKFAREILGAGRKPSQLEIRTLATHKKGPWYSEAIVSLVWHKGPTVQPMLHLYFDSQMRYAVTECLKTLNSKN